MTVTLDIPDEIARELAAAGEELSHAALEGLALGGYRRGTLTQLHVGRLLGLTRIQAEDFLKATTHEKCSRDKIESGFQRQGSPRWCQPKSLN